MNKKFEQAQTSKYGDKIIEKDVIVPLISASGRYRLGVPSRPEIRHDNGFLGKFSKEDPTFSDKSQLAYWRTKLEGAEALRPGLADATAAYRHFLSGSGVDRNINYERYISEDKSGEITLKRICDDFIFNATIIGENREEFSVTSTTYSLGGGSQFPYPETENWQKAIGAHFAWVSGIVFIKTNSKTLKDEFEATITIHVEDKYNFNPGASDIVTGIPDSANGRFEITGLAKQYINYASISRNLKWNEDDGIEASSSSTSGEPRRRQRRPSDNRRLRNRV